MRKVTLCAHDLELFDTDITFADFEFITKHWDAFRRMWKEQGYKFWIKFIVTFRNVAGVGVIKDLPEINEKYTTIMDETFIFIHEQFVESKYRGARNFIDQILFLAQNKGSMQHITQKSFSKDPFYNKETRDCFRFLFGPPTERISYLKTCVLHDLYTKFGGAVCKCLKRWLEAEEIDPNDDTFWNQASPVCRPLNHMNKAICPYCRFFVGLEGPRTRSNHHVTTFIYEKRSGFGCGPWYVAAWPLHKDPRVFDSKNPLYDLGCEALTDWRIGLSFTAFSSFMEYVQKHYPSPAEADLQADPADDLPDQTVELLKSLFEAGIGESILENLPNKSVIDHAELADIVNRHVDREKLLDQCKHLHLEAKMTQDTNQSTHTCTDVKAPETASKADSIKVELVPDEKTVNPQLTLNKTSVQNTSISSADTKQATSEELFNGSAEHEKTVGRKVTTVAGKNSIDGKQLTHTKPAANKRNATTQTARSPVLVFPGQGAAKPELHNEKKAFQKAEAGARPKQDMSLTLNQQLNKVSVNASNVTNKKQHQVQEGTNWPREDLSSNLSHAVKKMSVTTVTAPNDANKKPRQLQQCANCNEPEPAPKTFKICQRCKTLKSGMSRYYCGRSCQLEDWKKHKLDHGST